MMYDDLLNRPSVHFQHHYQAKQKCGSVGLMTGNPWINDGNIYPI